MTLVSLCIVALLFVAPLLYHTDIRRNRFFSIGVLAAVGLAAFAAAHARGG